MGPCKLFEFFDNFPRIHNLIDRNENISEDELKTMIETFENLNLDEEQEHHLATRRMPHYYEDEQTPIKYATMLRLIKGAKDPFAALYVVRPMSEKPNGCCWRSG